MRSANRSNLPESTVLADQQALGDEEGRTIREVCAAVGTVDRVGRTALGRGAPRQQIVPVFTDHGTQSRVEFEFPVMIVLDQAITVLGYLNAKLIDEIRHAPSYRRGIQPVHSKSSQSHAIQPYPNICVNYTASD
jgi:hypothetical protein